MEQNETPSSSPTLPLHTMLAEQLDWHWQNHLRAPPGRAERRGVPVGTRAGRLERTAPRHRGRPDPGGCRCVSPSEGPYAEAALADLVLHINREVIHHGAEVLLLRDLYRSRPGG